MGRVSGKRDSLARRVVAKRWPLWPFSREENSKELYQCAATHADDVKEIGFGHS